MINYESKYDILQFASETENLQIYEKLNKLLKLYAHHNVRLHSKLL